jgi:RNA polymerase sigma factor (TIGR02999 family)
MRRVLVDAARARRAGKRGGGDLKVSLDRALGVATDSDLDVVALDQALDALAKLDARKSQVVELRFFGGLTLAETAAVLKMSEDTVARDWNFVKTWLRRELRGQKQAS